MPSDNELCEELKAADRDVFSSWLFSDLSAAFDTDDHSFLQQWLEPEVLMRLNELPCNVPLIVSPGCHKM